MTDSAAPTSAALGTFDRFSTAWLSCLRLVLAHGSPVRDDGLLLREVLNVSLTASDCIYEDLLAAGAEVDRIELMVEKYESMNVLPMYPMSYGRLFREHAGVDQLDWLIRRLKLRPESKSATIGFHTPGADTLSCISLVDCKLRDGRLHLTGVYRSQNVYASQPGNAYALRRLQDRIADELGARTGTLTLHVMSAHIYERDWDAAERVVSQSLDGRAAGASGHDHGA
ncbi:thymidylate synthase [Micromonospora viridifaciens]|uniref:Thymidylate synthase n=1 Tax=Micromonospora viridifaciens TaxID=1881 RepID=A0A1C4YNI8_MICVI|nr:thymidylate synthase [Micromonospora viridifaciens]SCF22207.1 thymidylate synthase [Micromonospora viridifaciens]